MHKYQLSVRSQGGEDVRVSKEGKQVEATTTTKQIRASGGNYNTRFAPTDAGF